MSSMAKKDVRKAYKEIFGISGMPYMLGKSDSELLKKDVNILANNINELELENEELKEQMQSMVSIEDVKKIVIDKIKELEEEKVYSFETADIKRIQVKYLIDILNKLDKLKGE